MELFKRLWPDPIPGDFFAPEPDFEGYYCAPGDIVSDGQRTAVVEKTVAISPYFDEEIAGIERVYVIAEDGRWSDYWLPQDILILKTKAA